MRPHSREAMGRTAVGHAVGAARRPRASPRSDLRAACAVERRRSRDGVEPRLGVGLGAGHALGERLVPDRRRLGPADSGDRRAVARRAVAVRALAAAVRQQEEEVVAHSRGVVRVRARHRGAPARVRDSVAARIVHVAQRRPVAVDVDLLADQEVRRVVGVVGVELDHRPEDVAGRLVEAAGITGVVEVGRVLGDAVRHLVARDIELDQWCLVAGPVAVRHLTAVPVGVDVAVAGVNPRGDAAAVVEDALAAEARLEVVERLRGAVVSVDTGRSAVAHAEVAPHVVGVGERRAGAGRAVPEVARTPVAVRRVDHRVAAAAARRAEGDGADEDASARSVRGDTGLGCRRLLVGLGADLDRRRDRLLGAADLAGVGIGHDDLPARRLAVGLDARHSRPPGENRLVLARVDDELRRAGLGEAPPRELVAGPVGRGC